MLKDNNQGTQLELQNKLKNGTKKKTPNGSFAFADEAQKNIDSSRGTKKTPVIDFESRE